MTLDASSLSGLPFRIEHSYTRKDIYRLLNVPEDLQGGDWLTGYHEHGIDWYVFANVGTAARTGHDHANRWEGSDLLWHGKPRSKLSHDSIQRLLSGKGRVLIFTREHDRDPFIFEGYAIPKGEVADETPVQVLWGFTDDAGSLAAKLPEEIPDLPQYREGPGELVLVNRYERNRGARRACLAHYGHACVVCGLRFSERYGSLGADFIHVHHVRELSSIGREYVVDPIADLRPVCPNCHAMLHRRSPCLTVEELASMIPPKES